MIDVILYAVKVGNEDWQEELITTADASDKEKLSNAKAWAESQGFDRFRVAAFDGSAPDFTRIFIK